MRETLHKLFALWQKYEHHLGVGALAVGFTFDIILAKSPESVVDNILLVTYLCVAASIITILNLRKSRRVVQEGAAEKAEPLILLLLLQFCFGGLSSNMLVLYGKSGTLAGSAFFIALLVAMVFGNEYLRNRYAQLRFNIAVYYFLLLTYCTIAAPTWIFHAIGPGIFILSGLISLGIMAVFASILFIFVLRGNRKRQLQQILALITGIFIVFNLLYFFDIIPPVPLSLKEIGVYHSILRSSTGDYLVLYEAAPWYVFWRDTSATLHYEPGQSAYCFSSVYAPTNLSTPIFHVWEKYDTTTKSWDTMSRVSYDISGGRKAGYRGFSATASLTPGAWRCDVETSGGALIGRISFTAVEGEPTTPLQTATL
jgi:Protein of unknown function (DUF2914)